MNDDRRNAWKRHTGIDSLFNGGILGIAIAGLLLAVLVGPGPDMTAAPGQPATSASA